MDNSKRLKVLITAGATSVKIDDVRRITNTSSGNTGAAIAEFLSTYHDVTLLTSAPEKSRDFRVRSFQTYQELLESMERHIVDDGYDVIIHAAAVPDYFPGGMYAFKGGVLEPVEAAGKISSHHPELFLRLVPTQKIIDLIRDRWGFQGYLVKFKLEVNCSDEELIEIASKSRLHSKADLIVANSLNWYEDKAILIDDFGPKETIRGLLPASLKLKLDACC